MANVYLALDEDLEILPCLNKIDLASSRPDEVKEEIEDMIVAFRDATGKCEKRHRNRQSAGEDIVAKIPAPTGDPDGKLKALIFDSVYDNYKE